MWFKSGFKGRPVRLCSEMSPLWERAPPGVADFHGKVTNLRLFLRRRRQAAAVFEKTHVADTASRAVGHRSVLVEFLLNPKWVAYH